MSGQTYRLVRRGATGRMSPPVLDEHQRAVVAHEGGPLLVLAGPGTGKTTTIVESVVDRVERRGGDPERVLVLTFSRKAAQELRERITARMRRTTKTPLALTFHAYAYALLRREAVLAGEQPPRLLTGPEQLLEIRRLLRGEVEDGAADWPSPMRDPLKTRAFAEELRDLLARAAERGLDGDDLVRLGRAHSRKDWEAAGRFAHRYADRFDLDPTPTLDYAELIRAAVALLAGSEVRRRERAAYDVVYVDEYQDTDPAQEALLHHLAGDGRDLIAVGDPDQSIYGFRGADVRGILDFPRRFRTTGGQEAPVVALRVCRRSGPDLLAASRRVAARLPVPPMPSLTPEPSPSAAGVLDWDGLDWLDAPGQDGADGDGVNGSGDAASGGANGSGKPGPGAANGSGTASGRVARRFSGEDHRGLTSVDDADPGEVRVMLADSETQEAAVVADTLRRAHLLENVPWSRMAVLVRSAKLQVPMLRRALIAAGVPVLVNGDEVPLAQEPGVRPLVAVLRVAVSPETLDVATAEELLTGPFGGTDAIGVRRLRRALRAAELEATSDGDGAPPRTADELLVTALRDPSVLVPVEPHIAVPAERVATLVSVAREAVRAGVSPEEALWDIWQASGLADRWTDASITGGYRGAQADRDLDAVMTLFDHASRFVDRLPHAGPRVFLDDLASQEIPANTLAAHAPDAEAVRILTAHRAKGLEWDVVVVAGVQEGVWPDLRLRGSLLGVDELVEAAHGAAPGAADAASAALSSKLLAEERRLFYVAATRARRRLVVTAVGGEDTDERPSRFLSELLPGAIEEAAVDERARWLSMAALVAELRAAVCDAARPDRLRRAAAGHLARLARAGVPGAHPDEWYALTPLSDDRPLTWPENIVRISPSAVENFSKCGLRWLLETAVGASGTDVSRSLGSVIHALAALATTGGAADDLGKRLDEVWDELDFGGVWFNRRQRVVAEQMVGRFLTWHEGNPRELVGVEESFTAVLSDGVQIRGRVDRVERDGEGRAVIIDIKTGGTKPSDGDLARHPQLGVYQLAALLGAFERHGLTEPGGAALVQVGKAAGKEPREQQQPALADDPQPEWAETMVRDVATGMAAGVFKAQVNDGCRTCAARASCPVNDAGNQVC
ncbi:superfamily I DNA/RNA helicase/RecB family exonuclease [Sphaerisporangium rubeum]|uniref:DNA 3'-5' helicase n=2 Tax=Sphaerisporangium rubeum TaxID=321317 RepID=A0A7X0ILE7_9ACTN|nr:superfamily I DNA/RNA helicase/RecB family exonuclease [Sphaerisporangium rubeum]